MSSKRWLIGCTVLFGAVSLAAACGGDGNTTGTALITVAEGGTVEIPGQATKVVFPANAVDADTEVSVFLAALTDYASLDDGRAQVLAFEPEGISLQAPAALTIDPGEPAIDPAAQLSIRQYVDGGWYPPEVSSAQLGSGGLVSASVIYLAPVAIVASAGPSGSIEGTVLHLYTEEPLAGIEFELRAGAEVIGTATSDSEGAFSFAGVPVGSYVVHANVDPANNCYDDPVDRDAQVTADQATSVFFGFVPGPC